MDIIKKIRAEIDSNPLKYASLSNREIAALFNVKDIVSTRNTIEGTELFSYTNNAEYIALSDNKKLQWLSLCAIETIDKNAVPLIQDIFPSSSVTWRNIVRTETLSISNELGGGVVKVGWVEAARAL